MSRLNRDVYIAIALLVLCGAFFTVSFHIREIDYGILTPAAWPRIILVALTILSLTYLVQSLRHGAPPDDTKPFTITSTLEKYRNPLCCYGLFLAAFSIFFPKYQAERGKRTWTLLYPAIFMISLSLPAFMMGGPVRIGLGILLIAMGVRSLVKHHLNGWKMDRAASNAPQLREG